MNISQIIDNIFFLTTYFTYLIIFGTSFIFFHKVSNYFQFKKSNKMIKKLQSDNYNLIKVHQKEVKTLQNLYENIVSENEYLKDKLNNEEDIDIYQENFDTYQKYTNIKYKYNNLKIEYKQIKGKYIKTNNNYQQLLKDNEDLVEEYNNLLEHCGTLEEKFNNLEENSDSEKDYLEQQIVDIDAQVFEKNKKIETLERINSILSKELQERKIETIKLRKRKSI